MFSRVALMFHGLGYTEAGELGGDLVQSEVSAEPVQIAPQVKALSTKERH